MMTLCSKAAKKVGLDDGGYRPMFGEGFERGCRLSTSK